MADVLNPAKMMREGREQMRRDAEAAEQPEQPAAQPPGAPPGEKFREWMSPPSALLSTLDWQKEHGWFKAWAPFIAWAEQHNPAILAGLQAAEDRLTRVRKEAGSNSDIRVINAQSAVARGYHFLEQAYENAFKKTPRY